MSNEPLLQVEKLDKVFGNPKLPGIAVRAVSDVSLEIRAGQTYGLVGESGSGKSTLGRAIAMLQPPTAGKVVFDGQDLVPLSSAALRPVRQDIQMIFQDPFAALNPRKRIGSILAEPFRIHRTLPRAQWRARVGALLETVGLDPTHADRFPHEFSGGQRQRICIARALALDPKLVVADEAVSALDVSVQAQVLNLMIDLRRRLNLSYLFISHDLRVVRSISDVVGVMYLGRIVEQGPTDEIYDRPLHPYTKSLLSSVPKIRDGKDAKLRDWTILGGELPSPLNPPAGCAFSTRCPVRQDKCIAQRPSLVEVRPGRKLACHFPLDDAHKSSPTGKTEIHEASTVV